MKMGKMGDLAKRAVEETPVKDTEVKTPTHLCAHRFARRVGPHVANPLSKAAP